MPAKFRKYFACFFVTLFTLAMLWEKASAQTDMSIPFFPLHKGDVFFEHIYHALGAPFHEVNVGDYEFIYSVDTVVNGIRYIGDPNILYRTNGVDSVWALEGGKEQLQFEFGSVPVLDTIDLFGVRVQRMSLPLLSGGSGTDIYADRFGFVEGHHQWSPLVDSEHLTGCIINGTLYGSALGVMDARGKIIPSELNISSYPNPAADRISIVAGGIKHASVRITIADMLGRTVYRTEQRVSGPNAMLSYDASQLPAGEYVLRVDDEGKSSMQRLSVVR